MHELVLALARATTHSLAAIGAVITWPTAAIALASLVQKTGLLVLDEPNSNQTRTERGH